MPNGIPLRRTRYSGPCMCGKEALFTALHDSKQTRTEKLAGCMYRSLTTDMSALSSILAWNYSRVHAFWQLVLRQVDTRSL
jgi:hypothetical protein